MTHEIMFYTPAPKKLPLPPGCTHVDENVISNLFILLKMDMQKMAAGLAV